MSIMNLVTWATMKKNRTRTIVTMIGIILSATMFTAVTTFCSSMYSYLKEGAISSSGNYHFGVESISGETLLSVRDDKRLRAVHSAEVVGYAEIGSSNEYKPYLYVQAVDGEFISNMPVYVSRGRLPERAGEILLPEHLSYNGQVDFKLEDEITLELGDRQSEGSSLTQSNPFTYEANEEIIVRTTQTYIVVGFYERPRFEDYSAPGYTALIYRDEAIDPNASYDSFFLVNNPRANFDAFLMDSGIAEKCGVSITNTTVLMFDGYTLYDNWTNILYSIAGIFCILIFIGSVSLIYSAFSISVNERTKQFGLLSSIGATRKQIRRSVFTEALTLSVIAIPIGLLVGMLGMGITLYCCRGLFGTLFATSAGVEMRLHVSLSAIVLAVVIALLTVFVSVWIPSRRAMRISPIDAIRQTKDIKVEKRRVRTSKLFYKLFGAEGVLAKKYYARSRRRYRATIVSLAMSVMLFISASGFCMYLTKTVDIGANTSNYDIIMRLGTDDFARIRTALEADKSIRDFALIADSDSIFAYVPETDLTGKYLDMAHNLLPELPLVGVRVYYMEDSTYARLLERNGLDPNDFIGAEKIPAVVYNHGQYVEYIMDNGERNKVTHLYDVVNQGADTVMLVLPAKANDAPDGYYYVDTFISDSGEPLHYYGATNCEFECDEQGRPIGQPTMPVEYAETKIGAFIEELPTGLKTNKFMQLIYPMSAITGLEGDEQEYAHLYISAFDADSAVANLKAALDEAKVNYTAGSINNVMDNERMMRSIVSLIEVFSYGFIVLISLISIANVFNTISTNVALRKRDYAMLRSIGMTHRGMNRMMNFECILYGTRSLVIGFPLAVAFTYLMYMTLMDTLDFPFTLPWLSAVIAVLCVFIVVFASMLYSTGKIKRDNPIDALKDENI